MIEPHRSKLHRWRNRHDRPVEGCELPRDDLGRPGILIVDDNGVIRGLLESVLVQHGFAVWSAADCRQAVDVYWHAQAQIHLVLLDVCMPDIDGPHTFLALRAINPKARCCFMSASNGQYTTEDLLALGAAQAFDKPFRLVDLVQTLRQLAGLSCVRKGAFVRGTN